MNNSSLRNAVQALSIEDKMTMLREIQASLVDPNNPTETIHTTTTVYKTSSISKYRPKKVNSMGVDGASFIDRLLGDSSNTPALLLRELLHTRNQFSNIGFIDMADKNAKNFSAHISSWLDKDMIVAIKTKEQFQEIELASKIAGVNIDLVQEKGKRYFMFNPSLLLPYSRMDKGKHFDTIYLIYQYLKSYVPPAKSAYQDCFKKYKDAMVREYFKDSNQCTFDEFLDRSKEYINQQLEGKKPVLDGWFKPVV